MVGCPLGGLTSRWSAGWVSSRNSQRLCCLAPPPSPPWRNALRGRCNNDCIISFQSARRSSMHPLATHHLTYLIACDAAIWRYEINVYTFINSPTSYATLESTKLKLPLTIPPNAPRCFFPKQLPKPNCTMLLSQSKWVI